MEKPNKLEVVEAEIVKTEGETSIVSATDKNKFMMDEQLSRLTKTELKQVESLKKQIDFKSTLDLLNYGKALQEKRSAYSEAVLEKYKNKDIGVVGDTLTGLVTTLKEYQVDESEGFFSRLFKRSKNKIESIRIKYDNVNENVDKVAGKLEGEIITLSNDVILLDKMYEKNIEAFKEHTIFIIAAKQKLEDVRNTELLDLKLKAEETGLPEDAEAYKELDNKCNTFEKYIYDLELSRTLCLLSLPRLKAISTANEVLIQKIRTTINMTIPMWKDTIAQAVVAANTKKALDTQNAVDDATNIMLKNMSDNAREVSVNATKASQRGVVDVDTIKYMYDNMIQTITDIQAVEAEGKETRANNERELLAMEKEYSQTITVK